MQFSAAYKNALKLFLPNLRNRLNAVFCGLAKGLGEASNWSRRELFFNCRHLALNSFVYVYLTGL